MLAVAAPATDGRARVDMYLAGKGPQHGVICRVDAHGSAVSPPRSLLCDLQLLLTTGLRSY